MLRRLASGVIVTLLLTSMLTLALNIQPVKAEPKTIYVDDDNTFGPWDGSQLHPYQNITSGLEHAASGDTIFVYSGTYYENVVVNKTVSLVGENREAAIIDGNGGWTVISVTANDAEINGFTIRNGNFGLKLSSNNTIVRGNIALNNSLWGISLDRSIGSMIEANTATNNKGGIVLANSRENIVRNNTVVNNRVWGIGLMHSSYNNTIHDNTASNNGYGIKLFRSIQNNRVSNNKLTNNFWGIYLEKNSTNTITGNIVFNNHIGVFLVKSPNNMIIGNVISNNEHGVYLFASNSNIIYHNNFINNTEQALSEEEGIIIIWETSTQATPSNTWDDGCEGNYWSNYNGTDSDGDGIGDTPYVIDENNTDRYPLVHPWSSLPVHNINTGLGYATIQGAINANETLNGHTIFVEAGTYYENVELNKSVSLMGEDAETTIIDGNGTGDVILVEGVDSVTVTGFRVRNGNNGFYILGVNHTISRNIITNNTFHGIELVGIYNCLSKNTIASNLYGIILGGSGYNIISLNSIMSNQGGINLDENCKDNDISENTLTGNTMGIGIVGSNNSVFENTIKENWSGIEIAGTNNTIYHNNFINNTNQVWLQNSSNNAWDNGCEGNYWSNYNGTDLDGDGIGDTYLPWEGVDYYPLMNLYWNPADINHDLEVDIYDAVLVCAAYSSTPSDENWNCHCDIAEPYGIIDIYDIVMICSSYGEEYLP